MTIYRPPKRHYRHQVGWTGPPRAFDAVLNDLMRLTPPNVGFVQRVLHIPDFGYSVAERARHFPLIEEAVLCLAECGADVVVQTGCNWVHCAGHSLADIRRYRSRIENQYAIRFHLEGLCLIDAMRALGATNIAVNAGYNNRTWLDGYLRILAEDGLNVVCAQNFVEQGLFASEAEMTEQGFIFSEALARESMGRIRSAAPEADAILVMGMPSWETKFGTTVRTHSLIEGLESAVDKPIVSGDIALYWATLQSLRIAPTGLGGCLLERLRLAGSV